MRGPCRIKGCIYVICKKAVAVNMTVASACALHAKSLPPRLFTSVADIIQRHTVHEAPSVSLGNLCTEDICELAFRQRVRCPVLPGPLLAGHLRLVLACLLPLDGRTQQVGRHLRTAGGDHVLSCSRLVTASSARVTHSKRRISPVRGHAGWYCRWECSVRRQIATLIEHAVVVGFKGGSSTGRSGRLRGGN